MRDRQRASTRPRSRHRRLSWQMDVRFSITMPPGHKSLQNLRSRQIPDGQTGRGQHLLDGRHRRMFAQTTYTPFRTEPGAAPVRLIVVAGEAHARFPTGPVRATYSYRLHHRLRDGETLELDGRPPPPRRDRLSERHSRPQVRRLGLNHMPSRPLRRQRRLAGGTR